MMSLWTKCYDIFLLLPLLAKPVRSAGAWSFYIAAVTVLRFLGHQAVAVPPIWTKVSLTPVLPVPGLGARI